MSAQLQQWLDELCAKRQRWVSASRENNFDRGIWNATVDKYADPSHFIFELLQNAEDQAASWVSFRLEPNRIVFEHDGNPFVRDDIEGITGIGNTTKLDDGHKIGCFGIGFKSVYVVTERPEVHSLIEGQSLAFAIEDLVVPRLIETDHHDATTQIVLPLRADRAEVALDRARQGLISLGARSLLFLQHIKRLDWIDGESNGEIQVSDASGSIRSIDSKLPDGSQRLDRFLILKRSVERPEDQVLYEVNAAFRLNGGGDLVAEEAPTRLMVYFETEEPTGLHFTIHGPFQLTDNRGNIKRDDPWNAELVKAIAAMIADELPVLRDRGLLKRNVLDLLPNATDELPPAFAPILDKIVEKFGQEDLLPVHGGGFASAVTGIRGPADLRDILGVPGLADFCDRADRQWIIAALRNGRADAFINTLKIEEFGFADFFTSFCHVFGGQSLFYENQKLWRQRGLKWFNSRSDEELQRFYLALDMAQKAHKPTVSISDLSFVRLEDGRRHSPRHAVFAPSDNDIDSETDQGELYLVKKSLIRLGRGRGKEVEEFLRRMGVRDIDERAFLGAIIRTKYRGEGPRPNREQHLKHMRRFLKWWKDTENVALFRGTKFVKAGAEGAFHDPSEVYLGAPFQETGLSRIYDGQTKGRERAALWEGYKSLPRNDLIAFLKKCGLEDSLSVLSSRISVTHPYYRDLRHNWDSVRHTDTGLDIDYRIDQLPELLERCEPLISRIVWDTVRKVGAGVMLAAYSPNQTHTSRKRPSSLATVLRNTAWIPTKDGVLRKPCEIAASNLANGYSVAGNEDWLQAIGFGEEERQRGEQHKAKRQAAELIGLSPELVDRLGNLSPSALAALSADIMQSIDRQLYEPVEFPERETGNPTRRAERLAVRAQAAPQKNYSIRERNVRTSKPESRILARTYLEDQYTNALGDMVCQACHDKMPFNLPDGSPYFEAAEFLDSLEKEQAENHLALCPVCAAKWRHANSIDDGDLRAKIAEATSPEISVELAGEPTRIRFTQMHLGDMRTVSGIKSP